MKSFDKLKKDLDSASLISSVFDAARDDAELLWRLRHLGRISTVKIVDDCKSRTKTACIYKNGTRYNIEINSRFFNDYIESEDLLLLVIMHELLHKTRGDLNKTVQSDLPHNLNKFFINMAQDMIINCSLHYLYFSKVLSLHKKLYKNSIFPVNMLAPLEVLFPDPPKDLFHHRKTVMALKPGIKLLIDKVHELCGIYDIPKDSFNPNIDEFTNKAANIYIHSWWFVCPTSFDALFESIISLFKEYVKDDKIWKILELIFTGTVFIGNHDDEVFSFKFSSSSNKSSGNKSSTVKKLFDGDIDTEEEDRSNYYEMLKAIKETLEDSPKNQAVIDELSMEVGVVPFPGRRETFLIHSGYTPVFYPNSIYTKTTEEKGVRVYFDVSGSMFDSLPLFFNLLNYIRELLITPVYEFSTKVVPVAINEIEERVVRSTGGTSINCVLKHALEHQFHKILIITDGHVEEIDETIYNQCQQRLKIAVVFPNSYMMTSPLIELAGGEKMQGKSWFVLPKPGNIL